MSDLILHELPHSYNTRKVRIALGFKGLEFQGRTPRLSGFPGDRSQLVELSRQPRTPMLQHGNAVIFDSGAILRYLEANFPRTPPLFSTDYEEFGQIEAWESIARFDLLRPVRSVYGQVCGTAVDHALLRRANSELREISARIESQLATTPFLVGDRITAADVTAVPLVTLAVQEPEQTLRPAMRFFAEHFRLGEGRERTREWVAKVSVHDSRD